MKASGNLYVFIKTWCSLVLLKKLSQMIGDGQTAERAETMRQKCIASAKMFRCPSQQWLRANAYEDIPGAVAAAAEPLAVPHMLGLTMPEGMVDEIIGWAQVSARDKTICDQILCHTREAIGAPYYPRIVTAALWL